MIENGTYRELDAHSSYRTYYDVWVVRNIGGPGQRGEWVKELREQRWETKEAAIQFGKDMTNPLDAHPDRPVGFYVTQEVVSAMVIYGRDQ